MSMYVNPETLKYILITITVVLTFAVVYVIVEDVTND
jgi:hypothetical protein